MVTSGAVVHAGNMTATTNPNRRLERSRDRTIGGVAAGLAHYIGVDVSLVRLAFVALTLFGGSGPLLYLVAWIIMPAAPADPAATPPPPGPYAPPAPAQSAAPASTGPSSPAPDDGGAAER